MDRDTGAGGGNVDTRQTALFAELADSWWDPQGSSKPLHLMNPVRLDYVARHCALRGREVLDVGCGAGLLSEAMSARGARVTGIDATEEVLRVARQHALLSGVQVDYHRSLAEQWCETHAARYDAVTCMELIEHVPDPASLVQACARALRPGGHLFVSTINRTARAWLLAVVAAEYVLGMLPRGTHEYERLVRPSELDGWAREAGLTLVDLRGLHFNPLSERFRETRDVSVNYIAALRRDEA